MQSRSQSPLPQVITAFAQALVPEQTISHGQSSGHVMLAPLHALSPMHSMRQAPPLHIPVQAPGHWPMPGGVGSQEPVPVVVVEALVVVVSSVEVLPALVVVVPSVVDAVSVVVDPPVSVESSGDVACDVEVVDVDVDVVVTVSAPLDDDVVVVVVVASPVPSADPKGFTSSDLVSSAHAMATIDDRQHARIQRDIKPPPSP